MVFEAKKKRWHPESLGAKVLRSFSRDIKGQGSFSYLKQIFIGNFFRPKVREILPKIKNDLKMVDMVV